MQFESKSTPISDNKPFLCLSIHLLIQILREFLGIIFEFGLRRREFDDPHMKALP